MRLETFFEKFDQITDAPGAVVKMRELVLELAVRGRLVAGGWAASLNQSASSDPFPIPDHWRWSALSDAAACRAASKVSPSAITDADWVLDLEDIEGTTGQIIRYATFAERRSLSTKAAFKPGDVLYGKLRPYLNKVVIAVKPGYCTTEIIPLRPSPALSAEFLRIFLRSQTFLRYAAKLNYGMKMPRLGTKDLESAIIPLPPLDEQKHIVAKVDELMALCDRLEAQQQEREARHAELARASLARFADAPTPANLSLLFHPAFTIDPNDLRKSILTLAVQGKLVPQDPNDIPAERILDNVSSLREEFLQSKRAKAAKEIRELDNAKCSHDIPDSWIWCRFGDLVLDFRYGTSRRCARNASGVPVLRIPNIQRGRVNSTDLKFTEMPQAEFDGLRLHGGDLLLVRSNGSENLVGRSAVVSNEDEGFAYAGYLVRARLPKSEVSPFFIHIALSTPSVRDQIEGPIRTTSGVKNINTTELSNLLIPLPSLAEQRRIVTKVDQLMALVDVVEMQLGASGATAANLLSALVAELTA